MKIYLIFAEHDYDLGEHVPIGVYSSREKAIEALFAALETRKIPKLRDTGTRANFYGWEHADGTVPFLYEFEIDAKVSCPNDAVKVLQ